MPDDLEFEVNDLIDGRYRVLALLGRGGMGKVIKCYDEMLDKEVALKLLLDLDADQFAVRFQKEAQTTARLSHPNIVRVMDFGQTGAGELFLVMDLLEGKSLEDLLLEKGAFSVDETFEFGIQIGLALSHAHRNGVLHRDIKPSNVMLVKDDRGKYQAKLVDFGLAKFVQDDERLTSTGVGLGSPPYVSPEQGDGKEIDERADIYSFGCLLFAMLVGRPPFLADNPLATVLMHMKNPPPSLAEIKKEDFPLAVEALISRCLKKKPAQRPQSFDSLVEEIKSLKEALKYGTYLELNDTFDPARKEKLGLKKFSSLVTMSLIALTIGIVFFMDKTLLAGEMTRKLLHLPEPQATLTEKQKFDLENEGVSIGKAATQEFTDTKLKPQLIYKKKFNMYLAGGTWTDQQLIDQLANRKDIEILQIRKQNITGEGLKALSGSKIRSLDLSRSTVDDRNLGYLLEMPVLYELSLLNCPKLTDLGVKTIAQSKTIVSLYLDDTAISDSAIDYLASAGKLITFSMKGCKNIEGRSIGRLKKLGILLLARSGFKPANCGQLKELTNLAILDLCDLDIRNKDVANLEGLKVQDLKLSNNPKLTDSCLHSLEKMNLLKKVDLSGCSGISENARKNFANQSASSLKVIVSGDSDAGKI